MKIELADIISSEDKEVTKQAAIELTTPWKVGGRQYKVCRAPY